MATIAVIQMVLLSVAMAQPNYGDSNLDGLWIHVLSPGSPFLPSSAPCLLRGRPVVKRDDYTYTPGVGAHKYHRRSVAWNEARHICEEEGGHLAIVNSIAESNAIADILKKSGSTGDWTYIGFHDLFEEGEYVTIHGQSIAEAGFTGWRHDDPTATVQESCGAVDKDGALVDISCDVKIGFICELPVN